MPGNGSKRRWSVRLTASAQNDLDALPPSARSSIVSRLRGLEKEPIPLGKNLKRLRGPKRVVWRLRHGDYRILYRVEEEQVMVLKVVNRRDLARAAEQLG